MNNMTMKTKEIRDLIDFISQSGLNEVNIETEELKLSVKRNPDTRITEVAAAPVMRAAEPVAAPAAAPVASAPAAPAAPASKHTEIKSPMIGTFYRSASPESPSFVNVGDKVEKGQTICIIEAMKLFNEIEADASGTIVKVLVENASPVEFDQPLFLIDPA